MPARRTSPRRSATRPSSLHDQIAGPAADEFDNGEPRGFLAGATPWLALLALVLAAGALGYVVLGRSGGDETACRTAAWTAIPKDTDLPAAWALTSTDLNANGMTISIVGPTSADSTTNQPIVYASVTCYGDPTAAAGALEANRKAAETAGSTVTGRTANGQAYDVANTSGSRTTLFRVEGLIGQVADAGSASPADLAAITSALAQAMGDRTAAGVVSAAAPTDGAGASQDPLGSDDVGAGPSDAPFAPELEALLPRTITVGSAAGASPAPVTLSVMSASATDAFADDPGSRAFAARIRTLGSTFDQLQVGRAFDESGTVDVLIDAFHLPKADIAKLKAAVLDGWLSASVEGVANTTVTLGGKTLTKVDYGDAQPSEYVYVVDDAVIVIETLDPDVASAVAQALK